MLNKIAIAALLCVAIGCTSNYEVPDTFVFATTPYPRMAGNGIDKNWMNRFEGMCKAAAVAEKTQVVFLGDSITDQWNTQGKLVMQEYFGQYEPLNFGIGSERIEHLLWRLENGMLQPALQPKVFVMMIGTNNIGARNDPPEEVAAGIKKVIACLQKRCPESKVLLLALFPREQTPDAPRRMAVNAVNNIIKNFDDGQSVIYLDIGPALMNADGTLDKKIMPDFLHLTPAGYLIEAKAIAPTIKKMIDS